KAEAGKLSLKATDLDLEVTDSIAAEVSPGGSTTVPAHMIYDIVRKLPEGAQVVIEGTGERAVLTVRAGRSRFTLQTLPESDFPDLAAGEMTHSFKLAAADLKRLIDKTQFAISTEETRYYLNGIYMHAAGSGKNATLRAVATDGHRLAQNGRRNSAADRERRGRGGGRSFHGQDQARHRRGGADLQADRRHLSRLCPRHSRQQREDAYGRQEGLRAGGRSRVHRRQ